MAQWLRTLLALTEHPCLAAPNCLFNFNTGGLNASVLHMHMHSHDNLCPNTCAELEIVRIALSGLDSL